MAIYEFKVELRTEGRPFDDNWLAEMKRILLTIHDQINSPLQMAQRIHNEEGKPIGFWGSIAYGSGLAPHWGTGKNLRGQAGGEEPAEVETLQEAIDVLVATMEFDRDELLATSITDSVYYKYILAEFAHQLGHVRTTTGAIRVLAGEKEYWIVELPQS